MCATGVALRLSFRAVLERAGRVESMCSKVRHFCNHLAATNSKRWMLSMRRLRTDSRVERTCEASVDDCVCDGQATILEMVLVMVTTMRSFLALLPCSMLISIVLVGCGATERPGSIGARLSRDNETGALYVRDLFPGLAGERAGVLPGDEIIMIDGHYVRDVDAPRIREMLRGQVGTAVRLTIVRGELVVRLRMARSELREAHEEDPKPRMETLRE